VNKIKALEDELAGEELTDGEIECLVPVLVDQFGQGFLTER